MIEVTIEQIQEKFDSLPEELRWAIMGANVDEKLVAIGKINNLNIEQLGQLSLETHAVMLGFTHPDKFEESLRNSLNLSPEKTKILISEINEKILKEIKDKVLALHNQNKEDKGLDIVKEVKNAEENTNTTPVNTAIENTPKEKEVHTDTVKEEPKTLNNKADSILSAKLTGAFKINGTKTEHTLGNISKQNNSAQIEKKIDPYREIPE